MNGGSYTLPIINFDLPRSLSPEQIAALRALVVYLCGLRGQKQIFQKFNSLSENDIRNFKQGRVKFGYDPSDGRLHAFDRAVYSRFEKELADQAHIHAGVTPILQALYPDRVSQKREPLESMDRAAEALYALFDVSPDITERYAQVLVGVYDLYRRGDRQNSNPELVRNALRIAVRRTNGIPKLVFSLSYMRRDFYVSGGALGAPATGVVIPHGDNVSLAGIDRGSNDSPTLCILNVPTTNRPEYYYGGVQLRKNTAKRLISARCILMRKAEAAGKSDAEQEQIYRKARSDASIKEDTAEAYGLDPKLFGMICRAINNKIDNQSSYVLIDHPTTVPSHSQGWQDAVVPSRERRPFSPDDDQKAGDFVNVRFGASDGRIRLAHMHLKKSDIGNCFEFFTRRTHAKGVRTGQGWVYRLATTWIADGTVGAGTPDAGMRRRTILFERQRKNGVSVGDLFGLRLTASPMDNAISAHKIYCCKIIDPKVVPEVTARLELSKDFDLVDRGIQKALAGVLRNRGR